MRLELPGWSIVVPPRWTTVIAADQESLRLFLDADVQDDETFHRVAPLGIELSARLVRPPAPQTIEDYAESTMRRHVRQGTPEVSSRRVGEHDVRAFPWSNGVCSIETVFVQVPGAATLALLRFDVVAGFRRDGSVASGGEAAARILESVAISGLNADAG